MDTQLVQVGEDDVRQVLERGPEPPDKYCRDLEMGRILFFRKTPFVFPREDCDFLLGQKQVGAQYHKNIAYRPKQHRVTGASGKSPEDAARLLEIMGAYSRGVVSFLERLLPAYASAWRLDYASFRPQEERGRKLKLTARNDLLHVDAFPTRPTHGDRILRFFTNINPRQPRRWITGEPFDTLLRKEVEAGLRLPEPDEAFLKKARRGLASVGSSLGLPVARRSRYDEFMLGFHDYLKRSERYQSGCVRFERSFPPFSSWAVFTDGVPHAALSGQFALEQTLIVSRQSMALPELAPVNVLERLCGAPMAKSGA